MNKLTLVFLLIFIQTLSHAQVSDTGDKVGIGTNSPTSKLDVYRNSGNETIATFRTDEGLINISAAGSSTENPTYINYISSRNASNTAYEDFAIKTGGGIGQFLVKTNGNIGIGTSNPNARLDIVGGTFRVSQSSNQRLEISQNLNNDGTAILDNQAAIGDIKFQMSGEDRMTLKRNGNLGLGTNSPSSKLDVFRNSGNETIATFRTNEGTLNIAAAGPSTENPTYINYISSRNASNTAYEDFAIKTGGGIGQIIVKTNGSVGINTTTTGTHKLAVEGSIGAREIKVEASGWSDFVFYDDYKLPSLKEVENHIKEKGHLKDIPSAKEVEENGIYLGEMNSKLLQKIEELTLYTIQQEKKIKEQSKKIEDLESLNKKLLDLQKRLEKLEKK
ncbi:hypothetical protein [Ascidiimonas aurantiaca]|uniref:hypothetical protein n=1 Tax=Ascidiimonas aurantiaca TaxID=1685432 RepID=UPI0030EB3F91